MKLLLLYLIFFSSPFIFAFEVVQSTGDVVLHKEENHIKEISIKEGSLKFIFNKNKYDVFSNTILRFINNEIKIEKGQMRILVEKLEESKVISAVGTVTFLNPGDFIVQYEEEKARLIATVLEEGSALVQGHYREEVLNLQAREKGGFLGLKESEGPAFDILLKGRKSTRGNLFGPDPLTKETLSLLKSQFTIPLKVKVSRAPKVQAKEGQICGKPFAKFNECVWRCLEKDEKKVRDQSRLKQNCNLKNTKTRCVRERCLADGTWGDVTVLQGEARLVCATKSNKVESCPY